MSNNIRRYVLPIVGGLLCVGAVASGLALYPEPFEIVEGKTFNLWFKLRGNIKDSGNVGIVAIDNRSIDRYERWPWPRDLIALLLEKVCNAGPKLVVFDITFSHKSNTEKEIKATDSLANVAARCGNVLFPYYFVKEDREGIINLLPPPPEIPRFEFSADTNFKLEHLSPVIARELFLSSSQLLSGNKCGGHISKITEIDGAYRREIQALFYGGNFLPSMAIVAAGRYLNIPPEKIRILPGKGLQMGQYLMPMDEDGFSLLNYYGGRGAISAVSASDIFDNNYDAAKLRNKLIVIGLTASGLSEIYNTPFATVFSTAEERATAIDNTFNHSWLKRKISYGSTEMMILIIVGIIIAVIIPFAGFKLSGLICAALFFILLSASYFSFTHYLTWLKLTIPAFAPLIIFAVEAGIRISDRQKNKKAG